MHDLSLRIAVILVGAIVAVVVVATGATILFLSAGETGRMIVPVARYISAFAPLLDGDPSPGPISAPAELATAPPDGPVMNDLTAALRLALAELGEGRTALVIDPPDGGPIAALELDTGRWGLFAFPGPPGPQSDFWIVLASWLSLVVVGVSAVALIMARRVTRPFVLIEQAIASVGPDGVLPHTPEVGSGEVRHMASALNTLSDRLRTAMDSRMRLVAAAGHDLRTPMTRMRLRAEFLSDEDRSAWLGDLDELDAIADSAIRLVREEGAGEDRAPVQLDDLIRETVHELLEAAFKIEVGVLAPAPVTGGPLAIKRALRNLITNAATHGGGARLKLEVDGITARLSIEDDGPGIPEALLSQVFEPFFRASPARTQTTKGAGLGLAIAREIIERFGGRIEIRNRPEGGLQQVVHFKLAE